MYVLFFYGSGLGLHKADMPQSTDPKVMAEKFSQIFRTKTREEWTEIFKDLDACVFPVLEMDEAPTHPHNVETEIFLQNQNGTSEPAPAPKLSRTPAVRESLPMPDVGEHTIDELLAVGYSTESVNKLIAAEIVYQNKEISSKL